MYKDASATKKKKKHFKIKESTVKVSPKAG